MPFKISFTMEKEEKRAKRRTVVDKKHEIETPKNKRGRRKKKSEFHQKELESQYVEEKYEDQMINEDDMGIKKIDGTPKKEKTLEISKLLGLIHEIPEEIISDKQIYEQIRKNFMFILTIDNPQNLRTCFDILSQFVRDTIQFEFSHDTVTMNYYDQKSGELLVLEILASYLPSYIFSVLNEDEKDVIKERHKSEKNIKKRKKLIEKDIKKLERGAIYPVSLNLKTLKNKINGVKADTRMIWYVPKKGLNYLYIHRSSKSQPEVITESIVPFTKNSHTSIIINKEKFCYTAILRIDSREFNSCLKNHAGHAEDVEIKITKSSFSICFITKEDKSPDKTTFISKKGILEFDLKPEEIVSGIFPLAKLRKFTKHHNLGMLRIHFSNVDPLILSYELKDMGYLRLIIEPEKIIY